MIEVRRVYSVPKGISFALIAASIFSVIGVVVKVSTTELSVPVILFFRQLFSLLSVSPFLLAQGRRHGVAIIQTKRLGGHLARAIYGLAAMYFLFFTLSRLPLADAILLSYTRPLFLPLIVWIWQRKRIETAVWIGLLIGFLGVALILQPGATMFDIGVLTGLCSAISGAMAYLMIRRLGKTEPPVRILSFYFCFSVLISAIPLIWYWETPSWELWLLLALIGVLGAIYQLFLTLAYRYTRATLVGAVLYSAVVFTLVWDWLYWNHLPDLTSLIGIVFVCAGSIVAIAFARFKPAPGEQSAEAAAENREVDEG